MLIKLLPNQIARLWDIIRFGLVNTWPLATEKSNERVQEFLRNLLAETIQCWFAKDGEEFFGFLLTRINVCDITGSRSLHLISVYGFKVVPDNIWEIGIEQLKEFAKASDCKYITTTSDNPKILQILKKFNFTSTQFLSLEV